MTLFEYPRQYAVVLHIFGIGLLYSAILPMIAPFTLLFLLVKRKMDGFNLLLQVLLVQLLPQVFDIDLNALLAAENTCGGTEWTVYGSSSCHTASDESIGCHRRRVPAW